MKPLQNVRLFPEYLDVDKKTKYYYYLIWTRPKLMSLVTPASYGAILCDNGSAADVNCGGGQMAQNGCGGGGQAVISGAFCGGGGGVGGGFCGGGGGGSS
jgi:hypothetical protein